MEPPKSPRTISVVPLTGIDRELVYRVPASMADSISVGSLVRVPLLRRQELGIVRRLDMPEDFPRPRLRFIYEVVYPFPVLTADLLTLADWMRGYYAVSLEGVLEAMIPAVVRRGSRMKTQTVLRVVRNLNAEEAAHLQRRAPRQAEVYRFLVRQPKPFPKSLLIKSLRISPSSCQPLVRRGLLEERVERVVRHAYADELSAAEHVTAYDIQHTVEQRRAMEDVAASLRSNLFRVHLIHGVTGSGKTEVYMDALRHVLAEGGTALYLIPEVALTPQTIGRIRSRLAASSGESAVVWHSLLSDGERLDAWHALASGEAKVVVGARSAVFAPLPRLRLIVVDEEHEPAYKQGETPRYHGRDVAVYRAKLCRAVCLLGSATPSLETLYNAQIGKYRRNILSHRVDNRRMPLIHVVDMKRELVSQKGSAVFSRLLLDKLQERFESKQQSILFINRRGYSRSMFCPDCGYLAECDQCSVTVTYHRTDERLRCHLCGLEKRAPDRCPACRSTRIRWRGFGTQRVEEITRKFLPRARVVRIDADSMRRRHLFRRILADFRTGKIDVLVGTQMIAKGLDFPNVTLVGLIDADLALHIPDFRSAERSFQLLVQVAGRAGRGDRSGEVVVQSFLPHSAPIQYARQGDFDGFLESELQQRKEYHYPPFRHLIHHLFRAKNPEKVAFFAEHWVRRLESSPDLGRVEIRGPAPTPVEKVRGYYRYQVWYFVSSVSGFLPRLLEVRQEFKMDRDVIDVLDVDPVQMA